MENLENSNPRSNDSNGSNNVGNCFIVSELYPQYSFMISLVDLPIPSDGFSYDFVTNVNGNSLTYSYSSDPNQNPSAETKTYILPPFSITNDEITSNLIQTIYVNDQKNVVEPKSGTVSTIRFVGKWVRKPQINVGVTADANDPKAWWVNAFIIQSYTQPNQYFLVATCDIMPSLDGYGGPYTNILTSYASMYGGNLQVVPSRPISPELGSSEVTAIYVTEVLPPLTLGFFTVGVTALYSSSDVSQNYNPNPSTNTPDTTI